MIDTLNLPPFDGFDIISQTNYHQQSTKNNEDIIILYNCYQDQDHPTSQQSLVRDTMTSRLLYDDTQERRRRRS